jgi:hypothetical protein
MPTETESIPPLWPWCLRAPLATNNLGVSLSRESLSADPNGTQIHGGGQVGRWAVGRWAIIFMLIGADYLPQLAVCLLW